MQLLHLPYKVYEILTLFYDIILLHKAVVSKAIILYGSLVEDFYKHLV
jgi:hypothetical protein